MIAFKQQIEALNQVSYRNIVISPAGHLTQISRQNSLADLNQAIHIYWNQVNNLLKNHRTISLLDFAKHYYLQYHPDLTEKRTIDLSTPRDVTTPLQKFLYINYDCEMYQDTIQATTIKADNFFNILELS